MANQVAAALENARLLRQLRDAAETDLVTGVYSHRHLQDRIRQEAARATRAGRALALLFVDLDDFKTVNDSLDLWMLLSGDSREMAEQMKDVLEGYTQFHHFNRRELHLIEALRTLRMLHHAAWLAKRWQDPAFPIAFPWFGGPRYWEDLVLGLREQLGRMHEEPLQLPA